MNDVPSEGRLTLSFDDPTDVESVQDSGFRIQDSIDEDAPWYDLNGRKYTERPTKPGLYIHGGKKVIIDN